MSDKNRRYDDDDPRGTIYPDPTGDPHAEPDVHDPTSGYYPDRKDQREQYNRHTCQDCETEIPESHDHCGLCARKVSETTNCPWLQNKNSQTESDQETPDWTFGRVVCTVVTASTRWKALALGSSAFTLADTDALIGERDFHDADVKPVADFETAPAAHLTSGWGDVVDVAPLDSDEGEQLFETAVGRTVTKSGADTYIYLTEGDPLVSQVAIDALRDQITRKEEEYWIIPGIIRRYKSGYEDN